MQHILHILLQIDIDSVMLNIFTALTELSNIQQDTDNVTKHCIIKNFLHTLFCQIKKKKSRQDFNIKGIKLCVQTV